MTDNHNGWYTTVFNTWQGDRMGRKPTAGELATVHMLGLRPGKQALANAMYLRDKGATQGQVIMACGAPQLNRMRGLITDGYAKRVAVSPVDGHTVYRIELTAKGKAKVERATVAAAKADAAGAVTEGEAKPKAKRMRKAKAPKAAPPATSDAPVQGETGNVSPATTEPAAPQGDASPAPQA